MEQLAFLINKQFFIPIKITFKILESFLFQVVVFHSIINIEAKKNFLFSFYCSYLSNNFSLVSLAPSMQRTMSQVL